MVVLSCLIPEKNSLTLSCHHKQNLPAFFRFSESYEYVNLMVLCCNNSFLLGYTYVENINGNGNGVKLDDMA